jgi:hypothetical protein
VARMRRRHRAAPSLSGEAPNGPRLSTAPRR